MADGSIYEPLSIAAVAAFSFCSTSFCVFPVMECCFCFPVPDQIRLSSGPASKYMFYRPVQRKFSAQSRFHLHFFSYRSLPLNVTPAGNACGSCRLSGVCQKRFQRRARNKNSASHSDCMQPPAADQLICAATPNAQDFCNFFHTQRQWKIIQIINHCNFPLLGFDW